jgi:hypothetical protein
MLNQNFALQYKIGTRTLLCENLKEIEDGCLLGCSTV